ncbi:alpha/beta fold hydrolase [Yinghuangia soli]|uniref:Alpha/beta hydrolase n=1 Tax=Yinghuangia soli TaxID=2908204 RepID=A0AA41U204_9ACTN|nr:alpha/beta hydrolase [Yinghuangia soli]MCF2530206.1 alpha/beta hydrolase [Yinghuangia soli]
MTGAVRSWTESSLLLAGAEGGPGDEQGTALLLHYGDLPAATAAEDPAGEAPPVLLVHGYAGSIADWDGVAPELAEDRRVVAYDHRGHGASTKFGDRRAYGLDLLGADLEAFAARMLPGPVDLVGHSMGGVLALRYALAHPERVRSLVLMNTAPEPASSWGVRLLFRLLDVLVRRRGMGPVMWFVERMVPVPGDASPRDLARMERQAAAVAGMDPAAFVALGKAIRSYPSLRDRLSAVACPVTVLSGPHDPGLQTAAAHLAAGIPGARLVVLPGAGHNSQTEAPKEWLEAVRDHLARAAGTPASP